MISNCKSEFCRNLRSGKQRSLVRTTSAPNQVYQSERRQRVNANRGPTRSRVSEYEAIDARDEDLPSGGYDSDNRVSENPLPRYMQ